MDDERGPVLTAPTVDSAPTVTPSLKKDLTQVAVTEATMSEQPDQSLLNLDAQKNTGGETASDSNNAEIAKEKPQQTTSTTDAKTSATKDESPNTNTELPLKGVLAKINDLEKELAEVKARLKKSEASDSTTDSDKENEELSSEIKRLPFDQWQPGPAFFKRTDISKTNVLVVYSKKVSNSNASRADDSTTEGEHDMREKVERVQINSQVLVEELGSITGLSLSKTPCIMVPPFKVLVSERDKIKTQLDVRQKELSKIEEQVTTPPKVGPKTSDEDEKETKQKKAKRLVDHLSCLINFIDGDLKSILELTQKIADGTLEKISFDNLWYLFSPGDIIFSSIRPGKGNDDFSYPRAFCVHKVTGGRKVLSGRTTKASTQVHDKSSTAESDVRKAEEMSMGAMGVTVSPFKLDIHYVDFDGTYIGAQTIDKSVIKYYEGEKMITNLDFYPARFDPRQKDKFREIEKRGEKFISLVERPAHMLHDGMTVGEDAEHIHGEVQIDFRTGYSMSDEVDPKDLDIGNLKWSSGEDSEVWEAGEEKCSSEFCMLCTNNFDDNKYDHKRYDEYHAEHALKPVHIDDFEDELGRRGNRNLFGRLTPREVLGYFFRTREWHLFNMDNLRKVDTGNLKKVSPFDELVIKEDHKRLVLALVESHQSGSIKMKKKKNNSLEAPDVASSMDLVKGKGKGLVILLHGVPGVGKTSTAETVAEYTGRPLYPITCGDIGQVASDVEKNLERHFKLAHKWGCVLLLDEADVFLAERDRVGDVARNALVSVFLRTLEYYSGILFLTTNRVGTLDEAFRSRIHVQLYYPHLTKESTRKIWENSLRKIQRENEENRAQQNEDYVEITFTEDVLLRFAENHFEESQTNPDKKIWNGRQIRNAFQTAIALALYERKERIRKAANDQGKNPAELEKKKAYRSAKLLKRHFEEVDKAAQQYFKYLRDLDGLDPDERAHQEHVRAVDRDVNRKKRPFFKELEIIVCQN
ncbi:hypothetical protein BFW01_g9327 [Lasiodiplodia theobromae]|nr:hypothetical protein BFW01_g9327 [Lasiodiplodia theobromae]